MQEKDFHVRFLDRSFAAHYLITDASVRKVLQHLFTKDCLFGIDTETEALPNCKHIDTAALSPHLGQIRLVQIFDGSVSYVIDLRALDSFTLQLLKEFLRAKKFVAHNALFECMFFRRLGVERINLGCTYIAAKLIMHATYPSDEGLSASLENLVNQVFGQEILKKLQTSDWSAQELTFEQIEYAALDAVSVWFLAHKLAPGLERLGLNRSYKLCKNAQYAIADIQINGMAFDKERHLKLIPIWKEKLYAAKKKVLAMTGLEDLTPDTLGRWFEKNLPPNVLAVWPRTETEKLSTNADTLADFSFLPIVEPFSSYQEMKKLTSTYGHNLINQINPVTGRIHASYNICGARTGRLSSHHPNLQQCPRDSDIRANFYATGQHTIFSADYSQIELRVAAELSQDRQMLDAYRKGIDLHALTASKVTGKGIEAVSKDDRQLAKGINFGLLFGLGKQKFVHYANKSYGVKITQTEAEEAIDVFRETYSGYREWQLGQAEKCSHTQEVRTPCGKLRKLFPDNTYGTSMNTPVQGGAAEVMLYALIRLKQALAGSAAKLVNCVHDEILIEAPLGMDLKPIITECMTDAYTDVFPNGITNGLVGVGSGPNWAEAK